MGIKKLIKNFSLPIIIKCVQHLKQKRASRTQTIRQTNALVRMVREGRFVLLHPYAGLENNPRLIREIALDVIEDYIKVYGAIPTKELRYGIPSYNATLLRQPLALIKLPPMHEEYLNLVGDKTRNMIRKADRSGYEFKEFIWNDYLYDIHEINTSKTIRSAGAMRGWYTEPVQARNYSAEGQNYRKYYGAFKNGKLLAYLDLVLCGDHAFFRHFIGHAEHLKYGVMNGLVSQTVQKYIGHPRIRWLKYGSLPEGYDGSVYSFRKHAGFRGYATFLDLDDSSNLGQPL
jgi:hypothetical protein